MKQRTEHGPGENVLRLERNGGFKERLGSLELVLHRTDDAIQQQSTRVTPCIQLLSDSSQAWIHPKTFSKRICLNLPLTIPSD